MSGVYARTKAKQNPQTIDVISCVDSVYAFEPFNRHFYFTKKNVTTKKNILESAASSILLTNFTFFYLVMIGSTNVSQGCVVVVRRRSVRFRDFYINVANEVIG